MAIDDDLLSPQAVADPYSYFAVLRTEDPVHWNERHGSWVLTRYDDVLAGFRDPRLSSDRVVRAIESKTSACDRDTLEPTVRNLSRWMVFLDPPDHERLRGLVSRAFSPRAIQSLRTRIEHVVAELLDAADGGRMDVVGDFASVLPATVIAEMLGVPVADHERFKAWSDDIGDVVFGALGDAGRYKRAREGFVALDGYFRDLIGRYRREPQDNLITALVRAEQRGDVLTEDEVVSTCTLLLFAGHETTTDLLANGVLALLRHPDQMERLREEPWLVPSAVEEFLRYDGPSKLQVRRVVREVELRGKRLRPGDRVLLAQCAANRDPEVFHEPDRLDVARPDNRHVGFGYGIHFCLGASLARLEAQAAFDALVRLPSLTLDTDSVRWRPELLSRTLVSLPVSIS